jgi:hypothetical protein
MLPILLLMVWVADELANSNAQNHILSTAQSGVSPGRYVVLPDSMDDRNPTTATIPCLSQEGKQLRQD